VLTGCAHAAGESFTDRGAQRVGIVGDKGVGQPDRVPLLAAVDGPNQCPVGGIEFRHTGFLFDDGGAVEPDAALRGDYQVGTQTG